MQYIIIIIIKSREEIRYKLLKHTIERFHALRQDAGTERLFRNCTMLSLQTK
jgi:hypothetical protein